MKAIITVIGKDRPGIIAGVSNTLYKLNINILDVSQTVMDSYFCMIMLIDLSKNTLPFDEMKTVVQKTGDDLGMKIRLQRTETFDSMHRV